MRRSSWLLLFCFLGCEDKSELLITRWQKKNVEEKVLERSLASESKAYQCLDDIFTVETLKLEIKDLESAYKDGEKITGKWRHLDLSKLPIPQATFLKKFGNEIGDQGDPNAIDYSSCEDVPCIYNRIYQKENSVAGYVHYLWFLKFGHMLAADNKVFKVNDTYYETPREPGTYDLKNGTQITTRRFPLSAFLFNDKELYGFWWLSRLLDQNYKSIGFMKEIQMVPRGERLEAFENPWFCGLAHSQGHITLTSNCLSPENYGHSRVYFKLVTHELSHQLDLSRGTQRMAQYFSQGQTYLELTGFEKTEEMDPQGRPKITWKLPVSTPAVSDYAKTNPLENFADSMAIYRHDGDRARAGMSDKQFEFFGSMFYGGKDFQLETLMNSWIKAQSTKFSSRALNAVTGCLKNPVGPAVANGYIQARDLKVPVQKPVLNCLNLQSEQIRNQFISDVMLNEVEACSIVETRTNHAKVDELVKKEIVRALNDHLRSMKDDPSSLGVLSKFYEALNQSHMAYKAFVECYGEDKDCYPTQVKTLVEASAGELNFSTETLADFTTGYLNAHSHKSAEDSVLNSYQTFLRSRLALVSEGAATLWSGCKAAPAKDDENPQGNAFVTTTGYMVSSLFNCLNVGHGQAVKDLMSKMTVDGFVVEHPKEQLIMEKFIHDHLNTELHSLYEKDSKAERGEIETKFKASEASLREELESELAWAKDAKNFLTACRNEVMKVETELAYFHLKKDVIKPLGQAFCVEVIKGDKFKTWFTSQKPVFEQQVLKVLEEDMLKALNDGKADCLTKYPKIPVVERVYAKKREECYFKNWESLEDSVVQKHLKDASVIQLGLKAADLKSMLMNRREAIRSKFVTED